MHNKILSLFKNYNLETDFLRAIPEVSTEVNSQGILVKNFTNKFPDRAYYIFDTITIKDFGPITTIILTSKSYNFLKLYRYKRLINNLFKIYGSSIGKGKYSPLNDYRELADKKIDFCLLRSWPGIENELLPCDLCIDKVQKTVQLSIFGAVLYTEFSFQ